MFIPDARWESETTASIFCPKCNKIMVPFRRMAIDHTLICKDCNLTIKPKISDLRKVRVVFTMGAEEIKAIDVAGKERNTVKFSTVDYFPTLLRVEYGDIQFIVDRNDVRQMLENTQLVKEK